MTPRTNAAAQESARLDSKQPLLDECARLEAELREAREFIGDLIEIDHNDTDAAHWRSESVRIPSGLTLYVGGNKPKI
ncbi:MAG: hypothetical protein E6Q97_38680 [Desulfurellales bacterium]|nr:MAG: hypothetical protein E6Q97_38680 [Desulfurellales bacterium]